MKEDKCDYCGMELPEDFGLVAEWKARSKRTGEEYKSVYRRYCDIDCWLMTETKKLEEWK